MGGEVNTWPFQMASKDWGVNPKIMGKPPNHPFVHRVWNQYKPSILGYPYFWKHLLFHNNGMDIFEDSDI